MTGNDILILAHDEELMEKLNEIAELDRQMMRCTDASTRNAYRKAQLRIAKEVEEGFIIARVLA